MTSPQDIAELPSGELRAHRNVVNLLASQSTEKSFHFRLESLRRQAAAQATVLQEDRPLLSRELEDVVDLIRSLCFFL